MIRYTKGDIFNANTHAIVNTVNCVGVMGAGLALQFKHRYPLNFRAYADACKQGEVVPGRMFVFDMAREKHPRWLINFPTKRHWREPSYIEDIRAGLSDLADLIPTIGINSIAIPPLGCGLGGLDWHEVKGAIETALSHLNDTEIVIYTP